MVLSRKKRQKQRAELSNTETYPENPKNTLVDKGENATGNKRKRGKTGGEFEGKVGIFVQENGDKVVEKKRILEVGGVNEEKVVTLDGSDKKSDNNKKKKKKKKFKKKKTKVEVVEKEEDKPQAEVENVVVSRQIVQDDSKENDHGAKKVYIGGMPYYSTEDDIRSYFGHCGAITDVDCMFFPETGKFRGIAIVSFETEEAAESAMELDGTDIDGLYLTIQPYKTTRPTKTSNFSPPVIEGYNRIYAGNLSWNITEDDLRRFFSDCNISAIRLGNDKQTGDFKGYAHVDFADDASLNKALKLDQKIICGRPVKISRAVPKKGPVTNEMVKPENNGVTSEKPENNSGATVNSAVIPENNSEVSEVVPQPPENKSAVSSGKLKRRTCYDCGERGHISSDCPRKQNS